MIEIQINRKVKKNNLDLSMASVYWIISEIQVFETFIPDIKG